MIEVVKITDKSCQNYWQSLSISVIEVVNITDKSCQNYWQFVNFCDRGCQNYWQELLKLLTELSKLLTEYVNFCDRGCQNYWQKLSKLLTRVCHCCRRFYTVLSISTMLIVRFYLVLFPALLLTPPWSRRYRKSWNSWWRPLISWSRCTALPSIQTLCWDHQSKRITVRYSSYTYKSW